MKPSLNHRAMRLPFTHSELSVIRSGARVALHLLAIALVLLGVYWLSAWMEHAVTGRNETEPILPSHLMPWTEEAAEERPPLQFRQFPYYTDLTSSDGRTISAMLVERPDADRILFRRVSDNREFTITLERLDASSREMVRSIPAAGKSITLPEVTRLIFPTLPVLGEQEFPHNTGLTSADGRSIEATLLARPSAEEITFRRRTDGRVFTVSLSELSAQDQALVRKFTLFEP